MNMIINIYMTDINTNIHLLVYSYGDELALEDSRAISHPTPIDQPKVPTNPHAGKREATSQHHHRGQHTLHHAVQAVLGGFIL